MDIQGLRALCMIQVLLYHAWTIGSPVGVDAFIMISAFLMTTSFLRRAEVGRTPFFLERWANTFKRLLPPMVFVVLATLVGTIALLPKTRWREQIIESLASITYWQNWRLAYVSADYYASDNAAASPLQHLWSMSMQGQVFLIWPLLLTLFVLLSLRIKRSVRFVAFSGFAFLTVLSLAWLLFLAPQDASTYFDTRARIWEFSFGSAVAAIAPYLRLTEAWKQRLSWAALGVLVLYFLVPIGQYPGPMAFVPMSAVSVLLLFPSSRDGFSTRRLLSTKPLAVLGDNSYAIYLVHWPVFVFFLVAMNRTRLGVGAGLALMALSIGLSFLVTRYLDRPFQSGTWPNASLRNKVLVVVASLMVGLTPLAVFWFFLNTLVPASATAESPGPLSTDEFSRSHPGAGVLFENLTPNFTTKPIPNAFSTGTEWQILGGPCSEQDDLAFNQGTNNSCSARSGDPSASRAFVAGNSHAQQNILPQLLPLLEEEDWDAVAVLKGACSWGDPAFFTGECLEYNQKVAALVDRYRPDVAFLMVTRSAPDSPRETVLPGTEELVRNLTSQGITVFGIRDNLRSEDNLYECSSSRSARDPWGGCLLKEDEFFAAKNPAYFLTGIPGFHMIDMTDSYCQDGICPTIIGNVFVYLDSNHLTKQYSKTMAPYFVEEVRRGLASDGHRQKTS